jgi:HEAT repeat protein
MMRNLKEKMLALLQSEDFTKRHAELRSIPGRKAVNPIFSFLLHRDETIRWRAVTAMGVIVGCLADQDMESARVVMRRLLWSLNDESGGIGWGAPEAMGEIIAVHERLSKEYAHMLISYIREDGNYLEYELLQRGVLWAIGRAAETRREHMKEAITHLLPFLRSPDAVARGLAVRALGFLDPQAARSRIEPLLDDHGEITVYENGNLRQCKIKDLAREALEK